MVWEEDINEAAAGVNRKQVIFLEEADYIQISDRSSNLVDSYLGSK